MKHFAFALLGLLAIVFAVPCGAGENEAGTAGGHSAARAGASPAAADAGSPGPAAVTDEAPQAGSAGEAGGEKPASSAAAAGYLYDEVKKGNIKIEGATEADMEMPDR
jgi:hypothetical protein